MLHFDWQLGVMYGEIMTIFDYLLEDNPRWQSLLNVGFFIFLDRLHDIVIKKTINFCQLKWIC